MAGTSEDILVTIGTQLDDKGLKALNAELAKTGTVASRNAETGALSIKKLGAEAGGAAKGFVELAAKATAAYMAVKSMIDAYVGDAQAAAKMSLALKNNTTELTRQGKSVADLTKEFQEFASAQQQATGIGDEVTLSLMGTLTTLGTMPKDLKRVTAALQDMEAATGMSADSMARVWARLQEAPDEALGALSRVGVKIRKEMLEGMNVEQQRVFILEKLEKAFGGQAKAMADATGGIAQAKAAFGDFLEVLGRVVVTIAGPFIKVASEILTFVNNLPAGLQFVIVGMGALGAAMITTGTSFTVAAAAAKAFFVSLGPIGTIAAIVGTAVGAIALLTSETKTATEMYDDLTATFAKTDDTKKATGALKDQAKNLSNLKEGTEEYKKAVQSMLDQNSQLTQYGITAKSTYKQVQDAVDKLAASMVNLTNEEREQIATSSRRAQIRALGTITDPLSSVSSSQQAARDYARAYVTTLRATLGRELNAAEFQAAAQILSALPTGSGNYRGSALRELDLIKGASAGDVSRRTSAGGGGGSADAAQAKQDAVDLWKMRIDLMNNEFDKRRELNVKQTAEEYARIKALNIDENDKKEAIRLNQQKYLQEEEKIRMDQIEAEKQARIQMLNDVSSKIASGFDIGTQIIKKDWMGALGSFLGAIPAIGSMLQGVFGSAVSFFDSLIETSSEKMEANMSKAIDKAKARANAASRVSDIEDVDDNTKALQARRDALRANIEQVKADLKLTKDYTQEEWAEVLTTIEQGGLKGLKRISATNQLAQDLRGKGVTDRVKYLQGISSDLWAWINDLEDLEPKIVVSGYMDEIQKIQDQVDTGRLDEDEARRQMIDQYDAAIASLQGVAGAEELILELEKERYRLAKGITAEGEKQLLTDKQKATLAQIDALERDIETRRASKDYATMIRLQGLYTQLLGDMKGSGLFDTDVYRGIEDRLSGLVRGQIGDAGYALASGTGANAIIPTIPQANTYRPQINVDGRNTNTSQTVINAPINLPPDFVNWFMRSAMAQSQRSF